MEVKLPGHKARYDKMIKKAVKACTLMNGGMPVAEIAKRMGVTKARVYQWRNLVIQYGHERI